LEAKQFDHFARFVSRANSRRGLLRGLGAAVGAFLAGGRGNELLAAAYSVPLGGACYRDRQCFNEYVPTHRRQNPDLQIVHCADNGFSYDGEYNCCRNTGGACYGDEDCCGTRRCVRSFCKYVKSRRRARRPRIRRRRF
jgi:hypothetical protein